ncbi:MAG: hypothetical protein IKU34_08180 [Clostridia bacterium]|nr:hypothetical protein [Clostridia bacterium]
MKSDLTCPVEIVSVQVKEQEGEAKGQIVCLIDFFNLSTKVIDSLQMNIICFDAQGERLGGRLVRTAVVAEGRAYFSGSFAPEHVDGAVRVDAAVEKVWYQDGVLWRREDRNVREFTPNALPQGRELDRLKAVAGEDAAGYAREDDIVWMCVCGRANRTSDDKCLRCERERKQVLRDYSFSAIDSTLGQKERERQKQTQDNLRRSSEETVRSMKAQQKKHNKRRRFLTSVITALIALATILAMLRWGLPYAACLYAKDQLDKGLAADAKAVYLWVDDIWTGYMNAGEKANEAEQIIIEGLIASGQDEALEQAVKRALALGGERGDALYERAVLERAALKHRAGDLAGAEALYRTLENSETANSRLLALIYEIADNAAQQVSYPTAIERFASLGEYEDAAARLEDCIYLYGRQLMREGSYALACEQFIQVLSVPDAMNLLRSSRYALATELMEAQDYLEAAELFDSLGVYEEAEKRAKKCRYLVGTSLLSEGNLLDAAQQLRLAGNYEDATARFADTAFTLGCAALEEEDYPTAIVWLEQLERTGEAKDALNRAIYAYAQQLEAAGDRQSAALEYARVSDYEDAAQRSMALEYAIALEEMKDSPEAALARFEGLGKYEDAEEMALSCRYALAIAAAGKGDYKDAMERFAALGSHRDSASRVLSSRYAYAGQLFTDSLFDEAATQYQACGTYLNAEERVMRARYEAAAALETAGDYQGAAYAFAALGSFEDAKKRTDSNEKAWLGGVYNGAQMDMELGDYDNVITALEPYLDVKLPARYSTIPKMYETACLSLAQKLIEEAKPLDALPLLERIAGNKQADKLLDGYVYRIIGRWKDAKGAQYMFRPDGSCVIVGEEGYFGGKGYGIAVGSEPYPTKQTYGVVNLRGKNLTLMDEKTQEYIRLTYVGEATAKPQEEAAASDGAAEENAAQ